MSVAVDVAILYTYVSLCSDVQHVSLCSDVIICSCPDLRAKIFMFELLSGTGTNQQLHN